MKKFKKICNNIGKQVSKPFKQPQIILRAVNEVIIKPIDKSIVKPIEKTIKKIQGKHQKQYQERSSLVVSKLQEEPEVNQQKLQKMQENVQRQFIHLVSQKKINQNIQNKNGIHVCLIGPTSVGKKTLLNQILNLNLPVGLGSCTQQAQCITMKDGITYWNALGINKGFNFYRDIHLSFFNDMDVVYVLFDREVSEISQTIKFLKQMKKQVKYVRTKCDNWNQNNKRSLVEQLERDLKYIREIDQNCNEVIPSGYKMNDKVAKSLISLNKNSK